MRRRCGSVSATGVEPHMEKPRQSLMNLIQIQSGFCIPGTGSQSWRNPDRLSGESSVNNRINGCP